MYKIICLRPFSRLVIAGLVTCVIGIACAGSLMWAKSNSPVNLEKTGKVEAAVQKSSPPRFPIVLSNLTRFGFEPAAMRVPAGRCLLAIRNISDKETLELQVKRSGSSRALLAEQHRTGKSHWERFVEFEAGEYLITESGNAERALRLTVFSPEKQ